MQVKLYKYKGPVRYENEQPCDVEYHQTVKAAIEKVRNVRKGYKVKGEWIGWKIFDRHDKLIHKLR